MPMTLINARSAVIPMILLGVFLIPAAAATPDLSATADQYPDDDAVIVRWEQAWTWTPNGALTRRDHQWIKLFNSRPIDAVADPRIHYNKSEDTVTIHTAQTHLPDGGTIAVPDYSYNIAAPNDLSGWPAYAEWQDQIVSFSGIQDNAVTELDYEVTTKPGVLPWISEDLRIDDDYPIIERVVKLTVPAGTDVLEHLDRVNQQPEKTSGKGNDTYTWTFKNLPSGKGEPQSLSWQQRCPRLRFTTCPSAEAWVAAYVAPARRAAQTDDAIRAFAEAAIEHETNACEQTRKIAEKIGETFNMIDSPKARRSLQCRPAPEVLQANYGNPLEAAALLTAALRSLDIKADIDVAVNARAFSDKVPTDAMLDRLVAHVELDDGPLHIDPTDGVIHNPGSYGPRLLLGLNDAGEIRETRVYARGEHDPSQLRVTGRVNIDDQGNATGTLKLRLTGRFYDPTSLDSADAQKSLVKKTVASVITGPKVREYVITTLSDEALEATVELGDDEPLSSVDKLRLIELGDGPAFLDTVHLPLNRSQRNTRLDIGGAVQESVDITVELPDEWTAAVAPAALPKLAADWGAIEQQVDPSDGVLRIRREVNIDTDEVSPEAYQSLRTSVNDLRAAGSRTLMFGPKSAA